jgi:hypothetical protein
VVGISKDSVKSHGGFKEKIGIGFRLLSDPELVTHKAYGAWGKKVMYGKEVEGVIRSTFLVAPDGKLAKVEEREGRRARGQGPRRHSRGAGGRSRSEDRASSTRQCHEEEAGSVVTPDAATTIVWLGEQGADSQTSATLSAWARSRGLVLAPPAVWVPPTIARRPRHLRDDRGSAR